VWREWLNGCGQRDVDHKHPLSQAHDQWLMRDASPSASLPPPPCRTGSGGRDETELEHARRGHEGGRLEQLGQWMNNENGTRG
jgi:hypothetical protein